VTDESAKKLKAEILQDLAKVVEDQIEKEVEEEVEEHVANSTARFSHGLQKFKVSFIAVAATIMALGQFSEAVTLIEVGIDWLRSKVTHTVEYEMLSQVHVGNTQSYIEDIFGNPQVSRAVNDTVVANYYHDEKYLLTVFIGDERVVAYIMIPLLDDFEPLIHDGGSFQWRLGKSNYTTFPANPQLYIVDHSKTVSYYLEGLDTGRTGLFVQNYLGKVSLGASAPSEMLVELYDVEVNGTDEEVLKAQNHLRESTQPNLFGRGTLSIEEIQKSILTGAEFTSYFGQINASQ
jgi:hypothetical protein